ncbi:MAG TPA: caspase domain-containing protein [Xanthobacteraceae bacterium]
MHQIPKQIPNLILKFMAAALTFLAVALAPPAGAAPTEKRMALIIGNGAYQSGVLATTANDAGLIAQTLQAAGFDVVGARDLDEDSLRHAFRDFVDNASKAGPDTVVAIYFAGYALQLEGENYLLPVDATIGRDSDVPLHALRLSDYTHALAGLHLKASMVVLDAARANPFAMSGQPLASGLALVDPEPGALVAYNATPGTVAPESGQDGYGPYAKALAEMIRAGGLTPVDVFERVRLRVNAATRGAQVPWDASKIQAQFVFFERGPDAPPPAATPAQTAALQTEPIRDLGAQDAYQAALARDTLDAYEDFLNAYPRDPMAKRVRAIVAARREAITWRRTYQVDSPDAYWSYLRRYPRGPHVADARRRLAQLAAAFDPPPRFAMIDYDVPPPPPDEVVYYERPVLVFDDPVFGFAPPPPPPIYFLAPPPPEFIVLAPPPPPIGVFILPVPVFVPVPVYVVAPAYVAPPPNPIIFNNIHNTVVVNNTTNVVTVTNKSGQVLSTTPAVTPAGGKGVGAAAVAATLPPSLAAKVSNGQIPPAGGSNPAALGTNAATQGGINAATGSKALPIPGQNVDTGKDKGKIPLSTTNTPAANLDTGKDKGKTPLSTTNTPAANLDTGKDKGKNPLSTTNAPAANLDTGKDKGKIPLSTTNAHPANLDAAKPVDNDRKTLSNIHPNVDTGRKDTIAPVHTTTAPTAPVVHQTVAPPPPPPPVVHPPSPPPVRQVQAPPPPPSPHPAPPPPPAAAAAAKGGGGGGNAKCPVVNGKPTCK